MRLSLRTGPERGSAGCRWHRVQVNDRERVAAVIVRDGAVLMVRERMREASGRHEGREYWTLPGGGVLPGESADEAVRREVLEETGMTCGLVEPAFDFPYPSGRTSCYRVQVDSAQEPRLGTDDDLECDCPRMVGLDWIPLPGAIAEDGGLPVPVMLMVSPP